MKKAVLTIAMLLALTGNAMAMEIPTGTTVQNLNGSQQYIKTYTVAPGVDPQTLIEDSFAYEGYSYTYASIIKAENRSEDVRQHSETVTIETGKDNLTEVLAALAPTIDYASDAYKGTLSLDHTTIQTKAAGYVSKSYTVSDTKEIGNLSSNDMSYVPATTVKNGVILNLSGVDWQVQGTAMVDDALVPSSYKAVASYSNRASYKAATGYITTADYVGDISRSEVDSVTYTVTYLGRPIVPEVLPSVGMVAVLTHPWTIAGCGLALSATLAIFLILSRRELARLRAGTMVQDADYEETEEQAE